MEFYTKDMDSAFRFGDVLKGYFCVDHSVKTPVLLSSDPKGLDLSVVDIKVYLPSFCVVLTPCCSIGEQKICLTPLIQLRSTFFKNPYFKEDPLRINRKMKPLQSIVSRYSKSAKCPTRV